MDANQVPKAKQLSEVVFEVNVEVVDNEVPKPRYRTFEEFFEYRKKLKAL